MSRTSTVQLMTIQVFNESSNNHDQVLNPIKETKPCDLPIVEL